jgi:hypothetical protein
MKRNRKNRYFKLLFLLLFTTVCYLSITKSTYASEKKVNTRYLISQAKQVRTDTGKTFTLWTTTDKNLVRKDISVSTEEIAVITRAFLKHYDKYKQPDSLEKARNGMNFLLYMEAQGGGFYHFLDKSGKKIVSENMEPSLDETTANVFLTFTEAAKILKKDFSEFKTIESSILRMVKKLEESLESQETGFGTYKNYGKLKVPGWLIMGRGDLSSFYLLGLCNYYTVSRSGQIENVALKIAQGIAEFTNNDPEIFPLYAHLSYSDKPYNWKTSTAYQVAALSTASKTFQRKAWLDEAEKEAVGFLAHLPASYGPIFGFFPHPVTDLQTPAAAYALTLNFSTIAEITGEEQYEKIAGLCAAWFFKNNTPQKFMYSPEEGSCFREIRSNDIVREKCSVATAYSLLSLLEVQGKKSNNYLDFRPVTNHTYKVLKSETGIPVHADLEVTDWSYPYGQNGMVVVIRRMNTFWHKFPVEIEDDYFLRMAFLKQQFYSSAVAVNVRIDGGPILLVPLGGAQREPFMVKKRVTDPVRLSPGLHTVGVRYKGLLYTQPAIIDCVIVQPSLEYVRLVNDRKENILLMKNWNSAEKRLSIPEEIPASEVKVSARSLAGEKITNVFEVYKGKKYLRIPRESIGIFEW